MPFSFFLILSLNPHRSLSFSLQELLSRLSFVLILAELGKRASMQQRKRKREEKKLFSIRRDISQLSFPFPRSPFFLFLYLVQRQLDHHLALARVLKVSCLDDLGGRAHVVTAAAPAAAAKAATAAATAAAAKRRSATSAAASRGEASAATAAASSPARKASAASTAIHLRKGWMD
jgi:hypothetical protein